MYTICVDIIFTVPPGQPRANALSVQNIGATWVRLRWEPPLEVDYPISYYEIMVVNGCDIVRIDVIVITYVI
jgi:hypothetical protein